MEATVRHIIPQDKKPKSQKLYWLGVFLVCILIFNGCNSSSSSFKHSPSDTTKTVCLYVNPSNSSLALDYVIRITKDSAVIKDGKANEFRDSAYFTPFIFPIKKDGKGVLDSLGKPKMELSWQPHPKKLIIQDFNATFPLYLNK